MQKDSDFYTFWIIGTCMQYVETKLRDNLSLEEFFWISESLFKLISLSLFPWKLSLVRTRTGLFEISREMSRGTRRQQWEGRLVSLFSSRFRDLNSVKLSRAPQSRSTRLLFPSSRLRSPVRWSSGRAVRPVLDSRRSFSFCVKWNSSWVITIIVN